MCVKNNLDILNNASTPKATPYSSLEIGAFVCLPPNYSTDADVSYNSMCRSCVNWHSGTCHAENGACEFKYR